MPLQLSSAQAAKVVGISQRQISYWANTGLLRPSAQSGAGRGVRRAYSFQDMVALLTVAKLRQLNCPLQTIRNAVVSLRREFRSGSDADVLAKRTLLTDGKRVYLLEGEQVMDVLTRQFVLSVHMGLVVRELQNRIESTPVSWVESVAVKGEAYRLRVHYDPDEGYWVQCVELPGAIEQGETADEAVQAGRSAIESLLAVEARLNIRRRGARGVKAG